MGSKMVIHEIKDDCVIQVSCQEPSKSFKYSNVGPPAILKTLLIKLSTQNFEISYLESNKIIHDVVDDCVIKSPVMNP